MLDFKDNLETIRIKKLKFQQHLSIQYMLFSNKLNYLNSLNKSLKVHLNTYIKEKLSKLLRIY